MSFPINVQSAIEFQNMKCEEKDIAEREICYEAKVKEMTDAQEKQAIIKAAVGGAAGVLIAIGLTVAVYYLFIRRKKVVPPVVTPVVPPVAVPKTA